MNREQTTHWRLSLVSALFAATTLLAAPDAIAGKPGSGGGGTGGTCTTTIPVENSYVGFAVDLDLYARVSEQANILVIGTEVGVNVDAEISATGQLGPTKNEEQKEKHEGTALPLGVTLGVTHLDAVTKSMGNMTLSDTSIVGLDLKILNAVVVKAAHIASTAKALLNLPALTCPSGSVSGSLVGSANVSLTSGYEGLEIVILGKRIDVPTKPLPDTVVDVGIGTLQVIFNEQVDGANGLKTVTAIRIKGQAEVLVTSLLGITSKTTLDINLGIGVSAVAIIGICGNPTTECPPGCQARTFMTGGGWITLSGGEKGTFGFNGGEKGKAGGLQGRLNYRDHNNGAHLQGTAVTGYLVKADGKSADITYVCADGTSSCVLSVGDYGEPGGGVDTFSLLTGQGAATGPMITKGNVQFHRTGCPTTTSGGKKGGRQ